MKQNYIELLDLAKVQYNYDFENDISYSKKGFIEVNYIKKIIKKLKKDIINEKYLKNLLFLIECLLEDGRVVALKDYMNIMCHNELSCFDFELSINKNNIYYRYKKINNGKEEVFSSQYIKNDDYYTIKELFKNNDETYTKILLLDNVGIENFEYRVNKKRFQKRKNQTKNLKETKEIETKYKVSDDKVLKTYKKILLYSNNRNIIDNDMYFLGNILSYCDSFDSSKNFNEFDKKLFDQYINGDCCLDFIIEDLYKNKIKKKI